MTVKPDYVWCKGCGVEIFWGPVKIKDDTYCCQACSRGEVCACAYRLEQEDERRKDKQPSSAVETPYGE